jgi:regulator of sigma E protease
MLIFVGILLLLSLVILHEIGHFVAARRAGIDVEEFGIGFPPKVATITHKNGTDYTLNALPLGGFVKLKGEHDSDQEPGSFGVATLPQKISVMLAGVLMNVLIAIVLLTFVALAGVPKVLDNQFSIASDTEITQQDVIVTVADDTPASRASSILTSDTENGSEGLRLEDGDVLRLLRSQDCALPTTVDQVITSPEIVQQTDCVYPISMSADVRAATEALAQRGDEGQPVVLTIERDETYIDLYTTLLPALEVETSRLEQAVCEEEGRDDCEPAKGYLGVVPSDYVKQKSTWSAPIVGVVLTGQLFSETVKGVFGIFADLFSGNAAAAGDQVTGVVGIGYVLNELSQQGFMAVLFLTAVISVSLAVMNVLPIPALDGGRLFVTLLFRAAKKPLTKQTEERIHGTGFALLMFLFLLITILDVQKFILN